jgi:hypothetical protein
VASGAVFDFDSRMRIYRIIARWFIAPLFNSIISSRGDKIIWRSISKGMQGNDRPGCVVSDITPGPIAPRRIQWEELPESYDKRLVENSNRNLIERSATLLPQLREVLSQLAWTKPEQISLMMSNETTFVGNELVHTSYFTEEAIVELINCHLTRHNKAGVLQADSESTTARWCQRFRHKARDLTKDASLHKAALPLLGKRNRRCILAFLLAAAVLVGPFILGDPSSPYQQPLAVMALAASLVTFICTSLLMRRIKQGARYVRISGWSHKLAWCSVVVYTVLVAGPALSEALDRLFA